MGLEVRTVTVGDLDEYDRATLHANGIVVDVIANDDGSVYIELYAFERGKQAIVQSANIDRYKERHPNIRAYLADEPDRS